MQLVVVMMIKMMVVSATGTETQDSRRENGRETHTVDINNDPALIEGM